MSELNESTLQRLAFIRYLFGLGVEQSTAPEPLCYASILMFHDSIELALELASEELNVGAAKPEFMSCFDLLDKALAPRTLAQKEAMRRLNKARVALKHHGTFPSKMGVDSFRASATAFFDENVPLVFKLPFEEIALSNLISFVPAREDMRKAEKALAQADFDTASEMIGVAFARLVEETRRDEISAPKMPYLRTLQRSDYRNVSPELASLVESLRAGVEKLQEEVAVLRLGIDSRRLRLFRQLTPGIEVAASGVYAAWKMPRGSQLTRTQVSFCYNFVIESALKLQELNGAAWRDGAEIGSANGA